MDLPELDGRSLPFGAQIKLPTSVSAFVGGGAAAAAADVGITRLLDRVQQNKLPTSKQAAAGATVAVAALDDFFRDNPLPPGAPVASPALAPAPAPAFAPAPALAAPQPPAVFRRPLSIPSVAPVVAAKGSGGGDQHQQYAAAAAAPFAPVPPPLEQLLAQQRLEEQWQQRMQQQQQNMMMMMQTQAPVAGGGGGGGVFGVGSLMAPLSRASRSIVVHAVVALVLSFFASYYVLSRYMRDQEGEQEDRTLRCAAIAGAVCALACAVWWVMTSSLVELTEKQQPLIENADYWKRYYLG